MTILLPRTEILSATLVIVLAAVTSCGDDDGDGARSNPSTTDGGESDVPTVDNDEDELVGLASIDAVTFQVEDFGDDLWTDELIIQLDEGTARMSYVTASCSGEAEAPELPRAVSATYGDDHIIVAVDASVDCGEGSFDDEGFRRAAIIEFNEPIGSRELVIEDVTPHS